MAEPANTAGAPDASNANDERPESLSFTLQVVSPSVGVASPLTFERLPATTTIKDLKAKIRDVLPSKPTDESQRLIHRGRMLGREGDTMLNVFGQDTLGTSESQTLHLVLRPTTAEGPSVLPSTAPPVVGFQPPPSSVTNSASQDSRPQPTQTTPLPGLPLQQPLPGFQHLRQHQMLHQAEHTYNIMAQRIQQLQREATRLHQEMGSIEQRYRALQANQGVMNGPVASIPVTPRGGSPFQPPRIGQAPMPIPVYIQNMMAQPPRDRPMTTNDGRQSPGIASGGLPLPSTSGHPNVSGRSSPNLPPDHTTTFTREGLGPNGERWQVTVNETTTTFPAVRPSHHHHHQHHHHNPGHQNPILNPALNAAHIIQNADRFVRNPDTNSPGQPQVQTVTNTVRGTPGAGGVEHVTAERATNTSTTNSILPGIPSGAVNHRAIPENAYPVANTIHPVPGTQIPNANASRTQPDAIAALTALNNSEEPTVYILSSPAGPRALLLANTNTFFTPRQSRSHRTRSPAEAQGQVNPRGAIGLPEFRNRQPGRGARRNARQERENPLIPAAAPHANPEAGALGARIGPMIWLIVRLVGFVWYFTSGNASWTRWFVMNLLATIILLFNTGALNGMAEQVMGPLRQHLEALIPLAGPDAALIPAANAAAIPQVDPAAPADLPPVRNGPRGELDPAQVAARLMEQHRRQRERGWFMMQVRRVEHSLLLFLASLVPGVGERHIAAREAEANAARQRQVEASNAADAAAEQTASSEGIPTEHRTVDANENEEAQPHAGQEQGRPGAPPAPLVEV